MTKDLLNIQDGPAQPVSSLYIDNSLYIDMLLLFGSGARTRVVLAAHGLLVAGRLTHAERSQPAESVFDVDCGGEED
jgi:hypothetical protein